MVQALVTLDENTNRVLNVIKARYDLKDKGDAINFVVNKYIEAEAEPALRPDFISKIERIERQKSIRVDDFAKRYSIR